MARFFSKRKDSKDKEKDKKLGRPLFKRRKFCRFTAEGIKTVDYKDVDLLKDFINENGRIIPARISLFWVFRFMGANGSKRLSAGFHAP